MRVESSEKNCLHAGGTSHYLFHSVSRHGFQCRRKTQQMLFFKKKAALDSRVNNLTTSELFYRAVHYFEISATV